MKYLKMDWEVTYTKDQWYRSGVKSFYRFFFKPIIKSKRFSLKKDADDFAKEMTAKGKSHVVVSRIGHPLFGD